MEMPFRYLLCVKYKKSVFNMIQELEKCFWNATFAYLDANFKFSLMEKVLSRVLQLNKRKLTDKAKF